MLNKLLGITYSKRKDFHNSTFYLETGTRKALSFSFICELKDYKYSSGGRYGFYFGIAILCFALEIEYEF